MTFRFMYKPLREKAGLNKIDWLVNMFLPLLAADRLGRFIYEDLSKSKFNFQEGYIFKLILFFNNISYLLRLSMILITTIYMVWGLISAFREKRYNLASMGYKGIVLVFLILLILLYPIETEGGYIFGYWNKLTETVVAAS
jgi:hypothetical protein